MKCPTCQDVNLVISERQNVEIDYCPNCRGVWLDRGELDKIIDRSAALEAPHSTESSVDDRDYRRDKDRSRREAPKKKKRESFLSELFDF